MGPTTKAPLTAEEIMQLLRGTADLVNVAPSRSPNPAVASEFYESLPSFSQRFGYGRLNLASAMQAIDAGSFLPRSTSSRRPGSPSSIRTA